MKCLSLKEVASVLQIIIAVLCLIAIILLSMVIPFPEDLNLFMLQCNMSTIMVLCLIYGFQTWFYNSNNSKTRSHIRIMIIVVQWILFFLGLTAAVLFDLQFNGNPYVHFDKNIFDKRDRILLYTGEGFCFLALLLLLIVNIILIVKAVRKARN